MSTVFLEVLSMSGKYCNIEILLGYHTRKQGSVEPQIREDAFRFHPLRGTKECDHPVFQEEDLQPTSLGRPVGVKPRLRAQQLLLNSIQGLSRGCARILDGKFVFVLVRRGCLSIGILVLIFKDRV